MSKPERTDATISGAEMAALTFIGCIPTGIAFIGIGLVISSLLDEGMKCTWIIMGLVVAMYIIDIITNVVDALWTDVIGFFSLFNQYDPVSIMVDKTIPVVDIIYPLVIGIVGLAAAYYLFNKKEINA